MLLVVGVRYRCGVGGSGRQRPLEGHVHVAVAESAEQAFEHELGEYNPVISDGHRLYLTGASGIRAFEHETRAERKRDFERRRKAREQKADRERRQRAAKRAKGERQRAAKRAKLERQRKARNAKRERQRAAKRAKGEAGGGNSTG